MIHQSKKIKILATTIVLLVVYVTSGILFAFSEMTTRVWVLDVGQGTAILARTDAGETILFDTGPNATVVDKIREVSPWIRTIDYVILSHPQADHIGGMDAVLREFSVRNVVHTGVAYKSATYIRMNEGITREGSTVISANSAKKIIFDEDTYIELLFPYSPDQLHGFDDVNNTSVVSRFVDKNATLLIPGDIEVPVEEKIIRLYDLKSDVLIAPHHCSNSSSTDEFIDEVLPEYVICTVGKKNRYGHPHAEILTRYQSRGIGVMRTDDAGTINLRSDGETFIVKK